MMTNTAPPELAAYNLEDKTGDVRIVARLLGTGSSERPSKQRWFEVAIYKTEDNLYVVHTRGRTRVPGEFTKSRVVSTASSFEVIELLTVEQRQPIADRYVPRDSRRALAQAAQWDDDLMERYLDLTAPLG